MVKRWGLLVVVGVVLVAGLAWWLHGRGGDAPAPVTATRGPGAPAAVVHTDDAATLARVDVTVRDAAGPVAGAPVRFASNGDVQVIAADSHGVAHARALAAGTWTISASAAGHLPAAVTRELGAGDVVALDLVIDAGGRVLRGVVTDATGGPVIGARVDASRIGAGAQPDKAVATAVTDDGGTYAMTVAEGETLVAVSHADYAPQATYVEVTAAGATADFQLVPGGVIEGVVLDERTHAPVAHAHVEARRDSAAMLLAETSRRDVTSGLDGRFRVTGLRPGSYELAARAGEARTHAPTVVGVGVAEQTAQIELLVGRGPVVRGIAVDEAGAPAPGVTVTTIEGDDEAQTDAHGAFVLEGLAPGRYSLVGWGAQFVATRATPIELTTSDVANVRVAVQRALHVRGHVEPRQVCEVRLEPDDRTTFVPDDTEARGEAVTTGEDGAFDLGDAKPGPMMVTARCPAGDQGTLAVKIAAGMADVTVRVTPGASIAGHVVDGTGKPVVAVTVMAMPSGGTERTTIVNGRITSGVQAMTAPGGAFELRGLAAGTYQLRVLDRGRPLPMRTAEASARVTLAAGEKKTRVELAVDRADGVIRGVVTGPDGKPLADAWVSVHQDLEDLLSTMDRSQGSGAPRDGEPHGEESSRMVTVAASDDGSGTGGIAPVLTDASGHFEIGGLARVPWTVVAEAQAGKLRGRAPRVVPDATITLQALGVTELKGLVIAPVPLTTFTVELDGPTRAQRTFAAADGAFSFGRVDPGSYTVRVTSPVGNGEATVQVVSGRAASVSITLAANATVIGTLVDPTGKPLRGLGVTVVPDLGDGSVSVSLSGPPPTSGADGTFRVEAKAGTSTLVVLVQPRPVLRRGLALEAGKTLDAGKITVEVASPRTSSTGGSPARPATQPAAGTGPT